MTQDLAALVDGARSGRTRELARLISLVEDGAPAVPDLMRLLAGQQSESAAVVGITGAPGVGKSTATSALVGVYRDRGQRVGVLAVDPSSPFSGGALLGDRIRMQEHATDPGVFIRSMASRGHLGGLAASTPQAIRVLEATGFDVVLVETVGVGQSEVEVAASADTTIVLLAPGMGDSIQAAKAGILEIGDVFAVNKADRDGADGTARELRAMIRLGARPEGAWVPPVVKTVAASGDGIDALTAAIDEHRAWLLSSGQLAERRIRRAREEVSALAWGELRARFASGGPDNALEHAARAVAEGRMDPYTAASDLIAKLS